MMKLFHTPASHFVRKCTVTIKELGLEDRVEIITTHWPHSWGTETVPFRADFVDATPIARIPALVTEDGERLTESSLICEYLNDELGDFRLCPQSGRERWRILSVMSIATSGVMESQVMRRAELLRKREESQNKQEFSPGFVKKMMERQDRCYKRLDELSHDFRADIDLGQIAVGCACAVSDFRFPEDDWRGIAPNLARWYDRFRRRPSMRETEPQETPFDAEDARLVVKPREAKLSAVAGNGKSTAA
jgi:glutathione S-transferase